MAILLAIDDEPKILEIVQLLFTLPDYEVLTAATATAGINQFKEKCPDVVLLDVNLPDMSGLDAYRRLREHDRRVPVVFL